MSTVGIDCASCRYRRRCAPGAVKGIAIVGNMKTGKSTLFARLCGRDIRSLTLPGNTAAIRCGRIGASDIIAFDTPGILSVFSRNEDERASRALLLTDKAAVDIGGLVVVADAKNMVRSLAIVLQYAELGLPMVLAVNMTDEAAARGIQIDYDKLAARLGIDVVPTVASDGIGANRLRARLATMARARSPVRYHRPVEEYIELLHKLLAPGQISRRALALLLLAGDDAAERYVAEKYGGVMSQQLRDLATELRMEEPLAFAARLAQLYNDHARVIAEEVTRVDPHPKSPWLSRFGDWCTQLSTGIPIAFAVVFAVYLFLGPFAATLLSGAISGVLLEGVLIPWVTQLAEPIGNSFIRALLVDPNFGILPVGLLLPIGAILPVMFCFFVAFVILEDSGYLPRVSVLLNRLLRRIGLNAKAIIPLTMAFSCITMAILTTRALERERERNLAAFLMMLAMPCAPLLVVMMIILERMPATASLVVFGLIFGHIMVAGYLVNLILPGEPALLLMEIPPMRLPRARLIISRATGRTWHFLKEALPIFVLAAFMLFIFERVGGLELFEHALRPVIVGLMGLPEQTVQVFIKTLVRRETGAMELDRLRAGYTNLQLVVTIVAMTFTIPCLNSVVVLFKERGTRAAITIIAAVSVYAVAVAAGFNHLSLWLGITFT